MGSAFFISQVELDQPAEIDDAEVKPAGVPPSTTTGGKDEEHERAGQPWPAFP
jgi:hypothetical protein